MKRAFLTVGLLAFILSHLAPQMAFALEPVLAEQDTSEDVALPCHEMMAMTPASHDAPGKPESKSCCDEEGRCKSGACSLLALDLLPANTDLSALQLPGLALRIDPPGDGGLKPTHGPPRTTSSV